MVEGVGLHSHVDKDEDGKEGEQYLWT